jgi:CHASE1-domain containing sensor protein
MWDFILEHWAGVIVMIYIALIGLSVIYIQVRWGK